MDSERNQAAQSIDPPESDQATRARLGGVRDEMVKLADEMSPKDYPVSPLTEPPLESGLRSVVSALDALRAGSRCSLHLNPEEHAAITEEMKLDPPKHEGLRDLIAQLLTGREVDPPAPGTIPDDVQTA